MTQELILPEINVLKKLRTNGVNMFSLYRTFTFHKRCWIFRQVCYGYVYKSNSVTSYSTEHLSKLNNLHITPCGFAPVSFSIPASHYIRYDCPQCIIKVQSFLNLFSAVFTSDQPALQSAIIWNSYYVTLQISCKGTVRSEPFIHYPELMFFESLPIVISGN